MVARLRASATPRTAPAPARARSGPATTLPAALPAYTLYGEPQLAGLADVLHVETIAYRSRVHEWEIGAHRHAGLLQILVIRSGGVEAQLDARTVPLRGPGVITVPPLAAHGFRFTPDVDGAVFTVVEQHAASLGPPGPDWRAALWQLRAVAPVPPSVLDAANALRADYAALDRWRTLAVEAGLRRLLVEVVRAVPGGGGAHAQASSRALHHVQAYGALVDAQFRRQPTLDVLAAQIGITPTQLNRCCRRVLGHSALAVLHARLLLEAQRELKYTALSIKQIALGLGFADAGYFTRFFQRGTGRTPSAWRAAVAA